MPTRSHPAGQYRRSRSRLGAAVLALTFVSVTALVGPVLPAPAPAAPVSPDPAVAARATAAWLATQVGADGYVPTPADTPNIGATLDVALSLAATGSQEATFERIVTWLRANVATASAPEGTPSPGNLGQLLLVTAASGDDPTAFGGLDLVAALDATLGDFAPGLYGAADPSFDGVFRHSLAVLGLRAHGRPVPAAALDWLVAQQCGGGVTPGEANGGWQAYRSDLATPCPAPDLNTFSGPDTNSTALALQALIAASRSTAYDTLDFLLEAREADGGFGFLPGGGSDPNSTALVIQALAAAGQDPAADPWTLDGVGPLSSLLSWQLGCDAPASDRGALASPFSSGTPDQFASRQAPWGLAVRSFPLGPVTWGAAGDPCAPPTTGPTGPTGPTSPTTVDGPGTTTPTTSVPGVQAVQTTPRLAG